MNRFFVLSAVLPVAWLCLQPVEGQGLIERQAAAAVRSGDLLYVPGTLPTGPDGRIASTDIKAQTKQVLDNLGKVLEQNGSRMEKVAAVNVYLARAGDFAAMNEVYASYWPADPPARTTVVAKMPEPEALLQMSVVACLSSGKRSVVHPKEWIKSPSPYSYGVRVGDTLFLAGLVARNGKDNSTVKGDIDVQTRTAMANAAEILRAAGMTYGHVVSGRVYLTDTANFAAMNTAYRAHFPSDPPARATVITGLTSPDYLIEITLVAVGGSNRTVVTTPDETGKPGAANPNLSSAVLAGNRLFLSGMLGNTEKTAGDAGAQTREALSRLGRTLRARGFDWKHVVESTIFLTDVRHAQAAMAAYREVLGTASPATTTIGTGLVAPSGLVEITMTAAR